MHSKSDKPAVALEAELDALWRFALRLTASQDDAADLVQRTCVKAMEQHHKYTGKGSYRSWLFSIEHRIWLNELRSRHLRNHVSYDNLSAAADLDHRHEIQTVGVSGAVDVETHCLLDQVSEAVQALPEAQRLVMLLVCVEGFTYGESAKILDLPIGTVMSRLARARVAIGQFMQSGSGTPPVRVPGTQVLRSET